MDNIQRLMQIMENLAFIRQEREKLVAAVNALEAMSDELMELRGVILDQMRRDDTNA